MTNRLGAVLALACTLLNLTPACAQNTSVTTPLPSVTNHCASWSDVKGHAADSGVGCSGGSVFLTSPTSAGLAIIPDFFGDGTSRITLNTHKPFYLSKDAPYGGAGAGPTDAGDVECLRHANYSGSTSTGFVNPCIFSYTITSAGTGSSYEWPFLSRLDNNSTAADNSQNVAAYLQGRKLSTGATWAMTAELKDETADPTTPSVTDEHDLGAVGTDAHNNRVILDNFCKSDDGNPAACTYGVRINADTHATIAHGLVFNGNQGDGINTTGATFSGGAVVVGAGQKICFDGAGCGTYLFDSSGQVHIVASGTDMMQVTNLGVNAGGFNSAGGITLAGGSKLCFDGSTCSNYASMVSAGDIEISAASKVGLPITTALALSTPSLFANGAAGTARQLTYQTNGSNRWGIVAGSAAETGSNAGSPLNINAFDDTGAFLSTPFTIVRASGIASFNFDLTVASGHKLCLDGTACSNYQYLTGGSVHYVVGGTDSTQITSLGINSAGFNSAGGISIADGQKVCLNGSACTLYVYHDTSLNQIKMVTGSTTLFALNMSGQLVTSGGFVGPSLAAGVTCSGINAVTVTVSGGIVTHC